MVDDLDRRNAGTNVPLQRFGAALVGLILGQLAVSNSGTLAKLYVFLRQPDNYNTVRVAEVSVQAIAILALVGAVFGGWAAKRGWASFEQVVTSMVVASVAAALAILDQSLPVVSGNERLAFEETLYYLGWILGLLFVPAVLVPSADGGFAGWIRRGGGLVTVAAAMGLTGFLAGTVLEQVASLMLDAHLKDAQRFWMARPSTVNAIGGMYIVVAFSGIWWRDLWRSAIRARVLAAAISAFAVIYTGIYGWFFYAPSRDCAALWQFAVAFAAVPAVSALTVLAAYTMARQDSPASELGWPVSAPFWWSLPVGFSGGFALCAGLGFAPLAVQQGATGRQVTILIVAHAINGLVFGMAMRIMGWSVRLIPDVRGRHGSPPCRPTRH